MHCCCNFDAHPILSGTPALTAMLLQFDAHPTLSGTPALTAASNAGSESHFAVLTNDSFWRLYHIDDLTVAEQTFELQLSPDRYELSDLSTAAMHSISITLCGTHPSQHGPLHAHKDFATDTWASTLMKTWRIAGSMLWALHLVLHMLGNVSR